jgi:hypothetical protein
MANVKGERLIAGWGVRQIDPCGCDGRGIRPDETVCTCAAGKQLHEQAQEPQGERKVLAGEQR